MMRLFRRLRGGHWEHWMVENELGIESWIWIRVERCFRSYGTIEAAIQAAPPTAVPGTVPMKCEQW